MARSSKREKGKVVEELFQRDMGGGGSPLNTVELVEKCFGHVTGILKNKPKKT